MIQHRVYQYITVSSEVEEWEKNKNFGIDSNKIVYVNYGGEIGTQYNPVTIAQYALANLNKYIDTNIPRYRHTFFEQVNYLIRKYDNIDERNIGWPYLFEYKPYNLEKGWYSGLAQGQIISVMVRAYCLTNDEIYLPIIKKAMNFMLQELKEDQTGLLRYTPEGNVWIEEYPTKQPSLVLNGFVSSIFGIYDYLSIFPDVQEFEKIYDDALLSLKKSIHFYDTGKWLRYDRLHKKYVSKSYMEFQANQMLQMYLNTRDDFFLNLYVKYYKYTMSDHFLDNIIRKVKNRLRNFLN